MQKLPKVEPVADGAVIWQQAYERFRVTVYVPATKLPAEVVNFGFRAPYLMIFTEKELTPAEAESFAVTNGFAEIAASFGGSVAFFYPTCEGGWKNEGDGLFADIIAKSRISQYYKDGFAMMYDRFAKKMGDTFIRGAVLRSCIYAYGEAADYAAKYCLKTIQGQGLYGPGDITPVCVTLEGLSKMPRIYRRDIPVVSVGNRKEMNDRLTEGLDHVLVKDIAAPVEDYKNFVGNYRRMVGNLEQEANLAAIGLKLEPGVCTLKTSADNRGDDSATTEHAVGYLAYYTDSAKEAGTPMPVLFCFHGGGDSAICMATLSGWYEVAAKYHFLLISVENHLNSTATEMMQLLDELDKKYPIDRSRIYATGFSMGGCKSWDMFQEYPEVFAAVAPMDATFGVGLNAYGEPAPRVNQNTILPVFYAGGEITPLPELPFQEYKCLERMQYVLRVNRAKRQNNCEFDRQQDWEDPIFGIEGDEIRALMNPERDNSLLTLHFFESENGCCYSIFGSVGRQQHEVRHHTCENAWKFMNSFRRTADGNIVGGKMEDILKLYEV